MQTRIIQLQFIDNIDTGVALAERIGYPVTVRPGFVLGELGKGSASNSEELRKVLQRALDLSPLHEALIEKA